MIGLGLALLVELLLLLILLSLGIEAPPGDPKSNVTVVTLSPEASREAGPDPAPPSPEQPQEPQPQQPPSPEQPRPPQPTELPPRPAEPVPDQPAPPPARVPIPTPAAPAAPPTPAAPARTPAPPRQFYGPPNKGGSAMVRDTERVGTMPNGEPLYAAAWYREPADKMLGDYLSTAQGPGWGMIACRTAPDYRVEDCVALEEYPRGSRINRSILAAAWEFQVRPPRIGGRHLVGTWVRIRIDYSISRRSRAGAGMPHRPSAGAFLQRQVQAKLRFGGSSSRASAGTLMIQNTPD